MSKPCFCLLMIGLTVTLGVAVPAASQPKGDRPPRKATLSPQQIARQVYPVRGGQAKELATALTGHFKAEHEFSAVPESRSNSLLLSGPKAVIEEALAVLREIDRPARTVHVQVVLIDLTVKGGEAAGDGMDLDRMQWAGPVSEVNARLHELQKKGVIAALERIQLTASDRQPVQTQARESRPYTTSVAFIGGGFGGGFGGGGAFSGRGRDTQGGGRGTQEGGGSPAAGRGGRGAGRGAALDGDAFPASSRGTASRSISYREIGTSVQVRADIGLDGLVTLELHLEDSRMRPADGVSLATDERGSDIAATAFVLSNLESKLRVRPGHFVQAQGTHTAMKSGQTRKVVLVSAAAEDASGP